MNKYKYKIANKSKSIIQNEVTLKFLRSVGKLLNCTFRNAGSEPKHNLSKG